MYWDDHQPPHLHARYQDSKALYKFDGDLLSGKLPMKQDKLVKAWIELHKDELEANWILAENNEQLFKISPLS